MAQRILSELIDISGGAAGIRVIIKTQLGIEAKLLSIRSSQRTTIVPG